MMDDPSKGWKIDICLLIMDIKVSWNPNTWCLRVIGVQMGSISGEISKLTFKQRISISDAY